ncbi:MAG: methylenetetrahydrofolate reductase [NAD(P)H], partial [Pseudomonadota bacterium]
SQSEFKRTFSFELFPPKSEKGFDKLKASVRSLNELGPAYFSVTYGAGGSTRDRTVATVDWLRAQGIETAPHISCVGASREEIAELLQRYRSQGIRRLVAVRGDLPSGAGLHEPDELRYANELVAFIRAETSDSFHIEVAGYPEVHPQAPSARVDLKNFKRKVDAGANAAITQYFYNADAYRRFVDECDALDIGVPVVPGIMPITNYVQLARFSDGCGAEIPRWVRKRLEDFGEDMESLRAFGHEVVLALCDRLLELGAPGLHFYTMNQAAPTRAIWEALGLPRAS